MNSRTESVPLELADGTLIRVEATATGEEAVAFDARPFREVTGAIEGIANALSESLKRVQPDKATVEFGVELALDSGMLTAMIVKGTSTANLKITLEWGKGG